MSRAQHYYNIMRRELSDIESSFSRHPMYISEPEKHLKALSELFVTMDVKKARKVLFDRAEQLVSHSTNSADVEISNDIARYIAVVAAIGMLPFHQNNVVNRQHWLPIATFKHFSTVSRDKFNIPVLVQYRNRMFMRGNTNDTQFILASTQRHSRPLEEAFAYLDTQYANSTHSNLLAGVMFLMAHIRNPHIDNTPKTIAELLREAAHSLGDMGAMYVVVEHSTKGLYPLDAICPSRVFRRKAQGAWHEAYVMPITKRKLVFVSTQYVPTLFRYKVLDGYVRSVIASARCSERALYGDFASSVNLPPAPKPPVRCVVKKRIKLKENYTF